MLASVFSVFCLLALRGLAALVRAAALSEHLVFIMGRTRLRAGFVFALPGFQSSLFLAGQRETTTLLQRAGQAVWSNNSFNPMPLRGTG